MSPPASRRNHVPQSTPSESVSIRRDEARQKQLPTAGATPVDSIGCVLGLDVSLVGLGAALFPTNFRGDWSTVKRATFGYSLPMGASFSDHIGRLEFISGKVLDFAQANHVQNIGLESFPFGKTSAAHSLGKLHGVLMVDLSRAGFAVHSVPISSARKLLLEKLPRKAVKQSVADHWKKLRAPWATLDESDAAVCANFLSMRLGGSYFEGTRLWLPKSA